MADEETNENVTQTPDAANEPAAPAEAQTPASPKERRQRARAGRAAKAPAQTAATPADRQEQRAAQRRQKAASRRTERVRRRAKTRAQHTGAAVTPPREHVSGAQKTQQGVVVSDKADKTITVRIDVARRHRRYSKIVRTSSTLHAHDEANDANLGDTVLVRESRPLSRTKRWRLIEVVERAR